MPEEKHIIKKAIVEVHLPKADAAFDKQNKALIYFKENILPMIERIVDRLATGGETIRIDKLELDFYSFNASDTTDGALRKFEAQVEEKLLRLVAAEKQDDASEGSPDVKKIPKEKSGEELFFYLLQTGALPWWAKTDATVALEQLAQQLVQQSSASFKQKLMQLLSMPQVRQRIAYRLSAATTEKNNGACFIRNAAAAEEHFCFFKYIQTQH